MAIYEMSTKDKIVHATGYVMLVGLIGAFIGVFTANRKPWLTKKGQLIRTLKDITDMAEEILAQDLGRKKPRPIRSQHIKGQHVDDEQIDHIREHGEP